MKILKALINILIQQKKANLGFMIDKWILIIFLLVSCQMKEKKYEYYTNGKIKSEYYLINNKPDDTVRTYFENGKQKSVTYFKNGFKEGKSLDYFPNGKLKQIFNYSKGIREGEAISYLENGKFYHVYRYNNDTLIGNDTMFYANGNIYSMAYKYETKTVIRDYFNENKNIFRKQIKKDSVVHEYNVVGGKLKLDRITIIGKTKEIKKTIIIDSLISTQAVREALKLYPESSVLDLLR